MVVDRRSLLGSLVGGLLASTASRALSFKPPSCQAHKSSDRLVVDVHCHILNVRDVDRDAFVKRRILELDENRSIGALVVSAFAQLGYASAYLNTHTMASELEFIARNQKTWLRQPEAFCLPGPTDRTKVFGTEYEFSSPSGGAKPLAGMMNGRLANTVRMMHEYPTVDLFTPSMVDFYEGAENWYSENDTMSVVYERISQATFGRILPMVSFHPQRQADLQHREERLTPLGLVKKSIKDRNFVGVKLHPSVGYGPGGNAKLACPNSKRNRSVQVDQYRKRYGDRLDRALWELFEYCADNEVPILTHGSPGIPAYAACMKPEGVAPEEWLYAPLQWAAVLEQMKRRNPAKPLRICLGHFGGAFSSHSYWHPWMNNLLQAMSDHPSLYADLSIQSGLFDSDSGRRKALRSQFTKLYEDNKVLSQQSIYGSDWHMAEVATIGPAYLTDLVELVPASSRNRVFGLNAAEFLGLQKGRANRARIQDYMRWLEKKGRMPEGYQPAWMSKVDALT
jgi:predicted TIM-barrel fold metal-dependent hydrolase